MTEQKIFYCKRSQLLSLFSDKMWITFFGAVFGLSFRWVVLCHHFIQLKSDHEKPSPPLRDYIFLWHTLLWQNIYVACRVAFSSGWLLFSWKWPNTICAKVQDKKKHVKLGLRDWQFGLARGHNCGFTPACTKHPPLPPKKKSMSRKALYVTQTSFFLNLISCGALFSMSWWLVSPCQQLRLA